MDAPGRGFGSGAIPGLLGSVLINRGFLKVAIERVGGDVKHQEQDL